MLFERRIKRCSWHQKELQVQTGYDNIYRSKQSKNNSNVTWPKSFCRCLCLSLYYLPFKEIISLKETKAERLCKLLIQIKVWFPLQSSWHSSVLTAKFERYKCRPTWCSLPFSSKRFQLWTSVVYKCSAWRLPDLLYIFYFKAKAARKPSEFHAGISWTFSSPADNRYSVFHFQKLSWFKIWP